MADQQTLILIKPDAVQRGLVGTILSRFEQKTLRMIAMRLVLADEALAREHYAVHADRPFFAGLIHFITSAPLIALVIEGDSAIPVIRNLIGSTDGRTAPPGTIRGDFGMSVSQNLVHASDSQENAAKEIALWFPELITAS